MSELPERMLFWDTETSGVDIENDRIITCYAMLQDRHGNIEREWDWTIDPGVEIPAGASDVHGMSTEWVRENGRKDVSAAILEIFKVLRTASKAGIPIVAYNLPYDLSLLDREARRYGAPNGVRPIVSEGLFYDAIVHDRARDKYRKGGRKLMDLAAHYKIEIDESRLHEAKYDVEVTAAVSWKLLSREKLELSEMQDLLASWHHDWALGITAHFKKSGKTEDDGSPINVNGEWPYRRFAG